MALSGSSPYYMQRGMPPSGPVNLQPSVHGSPPGLQSLSNQSMPFGPMGSPSLPMEHPSSNTISPHGVNVNTPSMVGSSSEAAKRKRGRPRKYGPDTSGTVSLALSPSSATQPSSNTSPSDKRGRGRPPGTGKKQQLASLGDWLSGSAGMGFTPHIITIAVGEDIATKVLAFSQQGPRAICVLSANGAVSSVTLRQPSTSGGTVTYEGRFDILCLSGSYLLTSSGGSHQQTGGLSVSLTSPDGRVIGGSIGGMLIAASPVQVIVGSFLWGGSKTKNKKDEGSDSMKDTDHHQTVDNPVTTTSVQPVQNLNPNPSSLSVWPGPRQMDTRNAHAIDEAEDELSQHNAKKLIATSGKSLRGSIPINFPYFHVEFGLIKGFVHVIDDETQFPISFGLNNVIRGMFRLP
ncbi:hypothetical protein ACFE04_019385 [Oxalis oulophora]